MKYYTVRVLDQATDMRQLVAEGDARFEERMERALSSLGEITELRGFGLTGPTCSGKTTAARKMTEFLEEHGLTVHVISLDDFYYDKEYLHQRAEKDPNLEIDYDSEETIDIELLSDTVDGLFEGRTTQIPNFDFKSGKRSGGVLIRPKVRDVFLFEGIQTLYPKVHELLNRHDSYRSLAICPFSAITYGNESFLPNEIRLYRRLVRDYRHRATEPAFTFYLWHSVRNNEEKNIFPRLSLCHAAIDSTMPYEIGMLKPYLVPLLQKIERESAFYDEAQRILNKMSGIQTISSDYITERSLYKEFI